MFQMEKSHIMENAIFNELIYRGYSVDVGVVESYKKGPNNKTQRETREIDFVVNNGYNQCYIQSSFALLNEEALAREIRPFSIIKDSFKKIIVTWDELMPWYDEFGYFHIGLFDFLTNDNFF